jgi:hypothetical protein
MTRAHAALFAVAVSSFAIAAHAQKPAAPTPVDATPKSLADSLTGEAKQEYDRGIILYQDADNTGALAKFTRAYELAHDPRLLWNMATCQKGLRHYYKTYVLIEQYLREGSSILSVDTIARAEDTKRLLRDLFSPVTLAIAPATATVTLDGEAVPPGTTETGLDLGAHKLHVEAPNFEPVDQLIDVPGHTTVPVRVSLKAVVATSVLQVVAESGATITVDGQKPANGQWDGSVTPGKHTVVVTAPGKVTVKNEVDLAPGAKRSVLVPLKDVPTGVPAWVWIGGGVLIAGAVVGGYFIFKPKEETQAPPAGKLGTITLNLP